MLECWDPDLFQIIHEMWHQSMINIELRLSHDLCGMWFLVDQTEQLQDARVDALIKLLS